jgi:hypothetical protein
MIHFVANMGVHNELFEMPADGGTPKQLTDGRQRARLDADASRPVRFRHGRPDHAGDLGRWRPAEHWSA